MDLTKYFSKLPEELECSGAVDEYKLLALYVFNEYFNGDSINTDEVKDSICYSRDHKYNIDAVVVNGILEEDTLEVLFSYFVGDGMFNTMHIFNALDSISSYLNDIINKKFKSGYNQKAEQLISELYSELDNKEIIIRIITDYNPNSSEKFNIENQIEHYNFSTPKLKLSASIKFGSDVESSALANTEPYDSVKDGKLILDDANNVLKYQDNSFICNIRASSLKELWEKEGSRGLLAMNLRYYIKSGPIDDKIQESIMNDGSNFWYLNNGIIIVCDDYAMVGNELRMKNFSIVNGGQTTRMIGKIPFENDFFVSCKVVKNTFESSKEKNIFVSKVAEASNTQKPIKAKDIIANRPEQRDLKTLMSENKVYIEIKRGDKCDTKLFSEPWQRTKNNELAQDLYSFVYMEPGPTRNAVSKILINKDKYNIIFAKHTYDFEFLKSLLFLEKAFRTYKKKIEKTEGIDGIKKGLVKNGQFYCLAIIGYMLKLVYNPEFKANMEKYRNNEAFYKTYSPELAFNHGFIKQDNYKDFLKQSEHIFDYVFDNIIRNQFENARISNPSLAFSNWTKSNTGFDQIRRMINSNIFDMKDPNFLIDTFAHWFKTINDEQRNINIDMYVDYIKDNAGSNNAKNTTGEELSDSDAEIRNNLMIWRLDKSKELHWKAFMIFTNKEMDKMVELKPQTEAELCQIISKGRFELFGREILQIIQEHM